MLEAAQCSFGGHELLMEDQLSCPSDVVWCGTAAASYQFDSGCGQFADKVGEAIGSLGVEEFTLRILGYARVWLYENRHCRGLSQLSGYGAHRLKTLTTIRADDMGAVINER